MTGQNISHYKILEKLGEGGMGVVYKAEDTKLKRAVALKFLPPELTRDPEAKERFVHEAQAASAIEHNNICNIHEIDETEEGQTFIVMACYDGETLEEKIQRGPLKVEEALGIAIQISEGLKEAHDKSIVHRDIKPANIMITFKGQVKIMDFGLAKLRGRTKVTKEGTTLGTVAYMSPEQARGEEIDHRTDIWSLGVILYEMVTGQRPFKGEYEQAVVYSIMSEIPEPITGLRTGVPMALERIVAKLMAKRPEERYQHVGDLLVDLKALKKHVESAELPPQPIKKETRAGQRILVYGSILAVLTVFAAFVVLFFIFLSQFLPQKAESIDSIAVLPLENLSGDPGQDYFSDGMTEAVISELANIRALKVISRTSVMRYKETDKTVPDIAKELKVDAVVEGSVLRAGDRVRITAQLIEAREDRHLWAKNYECDLHDVLKLQSDVAQDIANEIRVSLTEQEKAILTASRSVNPEAHEAYLRGLYHWNKRTEEDLKKSIEYYDKAIEKESAFAVAYAALSQTYIVLTSWGYVSHTESHPKAREMAEKALEIDDRLAEAHTALGALSEGEWNWKEAENEYRRALELNPNYATGHQWYAEFLTVLERHEEARAEMKRALELDPLSLIINQNLGIVYFFARDYDSALKQFQKTSELEKNFGATLYYTFVAYFDKGMYAEAVQTYQEMLSLNEATRHLSEQAGRIYEEGGKEGFLRWILDNIEDISPLPYLMPYNLSMLHARLGENDEAFRYLDLMYEQRHPRLRYIKVMPPFDTIRSDARFMELLKKMGLEK